MNEEIATEAAIFLFWEYLFPFFGILSLQCEICKKIRAEYSRFLSLVDIFWEAFFSLVGVI